MIRVHVQESQRGKTLRVNACDLSEQNLRTLPQHCEMHTDKHTPCRSPGPCGLVLERVSFLRLRQRKPGTDRGPRTAASKPQEALVLSLPVEGVGAWGASCMCFHSQGRTAMNCASACVSACLSVPDGLAHTLHRHTTRSQEKVKCGLGSSTR